MSSERHKKKNREYFYLRCSHQKGNCNQKVIDEKVILEQLNNEVFHKIHLSPTMRDSLKTSIIQSLEDEKKINESVRKKAASEIAIIDNRLKHLWEYFLDRGITENQYKLEKQKYLGQRKDLEGRAEKYTDISNEIKENVEKAIDLASNLSTLMERATPDGKNTLLKSY